MIAPDLSEEPRTRFFFCTYSRGPIMIKHSYVACLAPRICGASRPEASSAACAACRHQLVPGAFRAATQRHTSVWKELPTKFSRRKNDMYIYIYIHIIQIDRSLSAYTPRGFQTAGVPLSFTGFSVVSGSSWTVYLEVHGTQ